MVQIADLDPTEPDGDTDPVAVLDDEIHQVKEAVQTSFGEEHYNNTGAHKFRSGNTASRPAAGNAGRLYINTELKTIQLDTGAGWTDIIFYNNRIAVGTYAGNGGANVAITGVGFQPTALWVYPLTGSNPSFFKGINFAAGDSHKLDDATTSNTGIDTLDSDGFTIDAAANVNAITYQYVAMRDRP